MRISEMLENIDRRIEAEEQRIGEGVAECRAKGISMHADYWHTLYKLREQRRTLLAVVGALQG